MSKLTTIGLCCLLLSITVTATSAYVFEQSLNSMSQVIRNRELSTFDVTADTYIDAGSTRNNYGGEALLQVESDGTNDKHVILRFDLSALPDTIKITHANLSIYYYGFAYGNDPVGRTYDSYRLTETDWVEGTQSGKKQNGASNWNFRQYRQSGGVYWTTPGGTYTTVNGSSSAIPASFGWMSWNLTDLVQYVVDQPSQTANLLIKDANEGSATSFAALFYSRESSYPNQIPILTVQYTMTG